MNEIQKEPVRANLGDEKRLMNHLRAIYEKASKDIASKLQFHDSKFAVMLMQVDDLDEEQLSELQAQIYQRDFQKQLKKQIDDIMKNINDEQYSNIDEFMKKSYENGFIGTLYDIQSQGVPLILPINQQEVLDAIQMNSKISKRLYNHLGENVDFLKKRIANNIARGIATSLSYKEIATNIERDSIIGFNRAMRIARTEGHNMRMQGIERAQHKAKEKGADIVKQWDATLDARTRDSHARLDGEIRELDEKFSNGMMRPGDKNAPAGEVVNCRCTMLQRARWALGVDELNTLKKRAEFFGLDKVKNFEEYRRKYVIVSEFMKSQEVKFSDLGKFTKTISSNEKINADYYSVLRKRFSHGSSVAKKVYNKYITKDYIENHEHIDVPIFNPETKKIKMNFFADITNERGAGATWFHEHGHLIDNLAGEASYDKKFLNLLKKDGISYKIKYMKKYDIDDIDICNSMISAELSSMRRHSAVSDLLGGLTNGEISGIAGHNDDYWNDALITSEAFAHMFEAEFDIIRKNEIKKYFPRALEYFELVIERISK